MRQDHKYRDDIEVWIDAYYNARERGLSVKAANGHADKEAKAWSERQMASAESRMEDR